MKTSKTIIKIEIYIILYTPLYTIVLYYTQLYATMSSSSYYKSSPINKYPVFGSKEAAFVASGIIESIAKSRTPDARIVITSKSYSSGSESGCSNCHTSSSSRAHNPIWSGSTSTSSGWLR